MQSTLPGDAAAAPGGPSRLDTCSHAVKTAYEESGPAPEDAAPRSEASLGNSLARGMRRRCCVSAVLGPASPGFTMATYHYVSRGFLGQSSIMVTMDIYGHLFPCEQKAWPGALDHAFAQFQTDIWN